MRIAENYPINKISWLSTSYGASIKNYYEPESVDELKDLCIKFYNEGIAFDLVGHTSNTLYTPNYVCEHLISTRKINTYEIKDNCIICQCGTPVRKLTLAAIEAGIKGFEGLIDLPGTVASAIYGHATCFGSDLSNLLVKATILTEDGQIRIVSPDWFGFEKRSSVLKRGEKKGIILTVTLRRENGNPDELKHLAEMYHAKRRAKQPEAKNSLGSIFAKSGRKTILNIALSVITKPYGFILKLMGANKQEVKKKRKYLTFLLLGARDVEPYVRGWNWFQWNDKASHDLFWKYVKLHKLMFTKSDFEIEIKK